MGKQHKGKSPAAKGRNDERPNGKSTKKHSGVAPGAHNGKTKGGYSPAKLAERAEKRALRAILDD